MSDAFFCGVSYRVSGARCEKTELLPYSDLSVGKRDKLSQEEVNSLLGGWLANRNALNHNHRAAALIRRFGLDECERFIRTTHAASLNDTFWVKPADEEISWSEVSLYRKSYDETISRFCLGESIPMDNGFSPDLTSAPELLTTGSFRRGFYKEGDRIQFCKADSNTGLESYSEVLASEIAQIIAPECSVKYRLVNRWDKKLSECSFFTDEETGFVPYFCFNTKIKPDPLEILDFYERIGSGDSFRKMMVIDALTFNVDRHINNFGLLMDNKTLELKGMAPVYDLNLALFGDMRNTDFEEFYSCAISHRPCIGTDFIRNGRQMLTAEIRHEVKMLTDFSFCFRGDEVFEAWRVEKLESIVREQAKAVLSDEDITVRNYYIDWKSDRVKEEEKKYEVIRELAHEFISELESTLVNTEYQQYEVSVMEDPELKQVEVIIDDPGCTGTYTLNFTGHSISHSGKQFPDELTDMICDRFSSFFV